MGNPNPSPATRFQPGHPKTPGSGHPKGPSIAKRIKLVLEQGQLPAVGQKIKGSILADELAIAFVRNALAGDFRFCQEIIDRMDGKVSNTILLGQEKEDVDELENLNDDELRTLRSLAEKMAVRTEEPDPESNGQTLPEKPR